jgi:uncharacterized radical SAM superfamily Fe-S cluster-containing enzyme
LVEDDRVWLVRECPEHGVIETLYEEDPRILDYLEQWTAPTKPPTPDDPDNADPVPTAYRRGLGALQIQHTCILLEDVTNACNLRCPNCFAGSAPQQSGMASVRDVLANVDRRLELEGGRLDVVMISGGEPTLHPELMGLLRELTDRDIVRILLNTNGVQLARNDGLVDFLESHNDRIETYFQFDGFRPATWRHHRGCDLAAVKRTALERLTAAGVFTTLVMTAEIDVNDDEIGDVVRFCLDTPFIGGVCIQPVFGSGRSTGIDPGRRLTHTGVLRRIGPQTGGVVTWEDLIGLPCSHPHCASVGYMLRTDDDDWQSLVSIIGHEQLAEHLDLVSNRIVDPSIAAELRALVRDSLRGLFSNQSSPNDDSFRELFRKVNNVCDLGVGSLLRGAAGTRHNHRKLRQLIATRIKRLQIKPFMDINTMLAERLHQCCVHVGTQGERHQCVPFCAAQAWPKLSEMKVGMVPPEAELVLGSGSTRP